VKDTREVTNFKRIVLAVPANIYLTQGDHYDFKIEGNSEEINKIITEVLGNKLIIKTKNRTRIRGSIDIYITTPAIEGLSITGSGDIISESLVKSDELDLEISGSGSIKINNLTATELNATITGSGSIKLSGKDVTEELDLTITGSGNFISSELKTNEAEVTITGSGSAKVHVLRELETNITGSGDVYYKGNPVINANSTGSGKTREMN
jgi:hypothetical protein